MMTRHSPDDMDQAHTLFGAACGHGALAAAIGISVCDACTQIPALVHKSWVNMPAMEAALLQARVRFQIVGRAWPSDGLALIQWEGPWTQPGVPARVACTKRHWIAVCEGQVWDANLQAWFGRKAWEEFAEELMPAKATGWTVARGYEITAPNS